MTESNEKQYLVWPLEEDQPGEKWRLVSAANEEEAVAKYMERVLAQDESWLEDVYTNTAHAPITRRFYMEKGVPLFDEQGDWTVDAHEARLIFERNVAAFFGQHRDWADLYLRFSFSNRETLWRKAMAQWQFPPEMIGFIFTKMGLSRCEVGSLALDAIERLD